MAYSIAQMVEGLRIDVEATESLLLAALSRGDAKAAAVWQATLASGKKALEAVEAYQVALNA